MMYYSTKTNANTPDTFKAIEQGYLGNFLGGQPHYYFGASQPTGKHFFDTSNITVLPQVTIPYGHREHLRSSRVVTANKYAEGVEAQLLFNAVENGAK
jgi:L-asparaginase